MAAITDLTWQQLETALVALGEANPIVVQGAAPNAKVFIDVSAVTGKNVTDLTNNGVVQFLLKLREGCVSAQNTLNQNQAQGERLNAFPATAYTGLVNGSVQVVGQITGVVSANPAIQSNITGPNI